MSYRENFALIDWSWVVSLPESKERRIVQRSDLACPMVVTDSMPPTISPADGKVYESKSAIRSGYKARGLVEVGNDPARLRNDPKPKPDRRAIKDTVEKATARFNRGERASRP